MSSAWPGSPSQNRPTISSSPTTATARYARDRRPPLPDARCQRRAKEGSSAARDRSVSASTDRSASSSGIVDSSPGLTRVPRREVRRSTSVAPHGRGRVTRRR